MRLLELSAKGWRNLEPFTLAPGPSVNVFFGDNAQGKTNLLEAIYYVATLRSFRAARPAQMIAWGGENLKLMARTEVGGVATRLEVMLGKIGRELLVDGAKVNATEDYFGGFNMVLFTPEHLGLVRGEPALRRQFMDRALFHVESSQLGLVKRYNHILRERNACLRRYENEPKRAWALLEAIDPQLCEVGAQMVVRRQQLLAEISPSFREIHGRVCGGTKEVSLRYRARGLGMRSGSVSPESDHEPAVDPSVDPAAPEDELCVEPAGEPAVDPSVDPSVDPAAPEDELCVEPTDQDRAIAEHRRKLGLALGARRADDLRRGFTGVGPHQDDLEVRLEGRSARISASQGETRTLVLALKLAEVEYVRDRRSEMPVLLLDDLGSELDDRRREELLDHVLGLGGQTFLSTVVPQSLPMPKKHMFFHIDNGAIRPASWPGFPGVQGPEDRL